MMDVETLAKEMVSLKPIQRYGFGWFARNCREMNSNGNYMDGFAVESDRRRKDPPYKDILIRYGIVVQTGWTLTGKNWYRLKGDAEYKMLKEALRLSGVQQEFDEAYAKALVKEVL